MALENQTYVKLNNGIEMPQFGMGVYMVPEGPETLNAVTEALRQGYRHIDTAHAYQNERSVGKAIAESGIPRDEIWITTKLWPSEYGRGKTAAAINKMLERLDTDLFEIVPSEPYPEGYDACCDIALNEQNSGARPAYEGDVDLASYDTVYLGYPIWWGDLPMCVYTFLESHDWAGKDIRPFCTHAGSGLAGTVGSIQAACAGANVDSGLSIAGTTAQNSREEARSAVSAWL